MDQGLIPRRYAKALFEVCQERKCSEQMYALMQTLTATFVAEPAMQQTISNPFVANADKTALINIAAGLNGEKPVATFADFIKLLERKGRIDICRDVAIAYIKLYREANRIFEVVVTSAAKLNEKTCARLTDLIKKHLGDGSLETHFEIEPSIIGGFSIKVGNELLDASVVSQLNQIRLSLQK